MTGRPMCCSRAQSTASLRNVPPCTTICSPRLSRLGTRTTFVNTFAMIERHRPAMISAGVRPFFCSLTMLEFMNTVQRLPSTAGCSLVNAASAISGVGTPSVCAKFSRNEPAAARAGLVYHDVADDAVGKPDGFHVLAADVEDEAGVGFVAGGGMGVRHRFDGMVIGVQRAVEQQLAVAGGADAGDVERDAGGSVSSRRLTSAPRATSSGSPSLLA